MAVSHAGLKEQVEGYLPADKVARVEEAYRFAEQAHRGQMRKSGKAYIEHPLHVAMALAELHLDSSTVVAGLLHDTLEDCGVTPEQIESAFGADVRQLVDGVTKLSKIEEQALRDVAAASGRHGQSLQAESLRKMLVAMAEDIRVILIKLADRLHNMQTIRALPPEKRERIARETLEVYAPLAHRLGISQMKWQLEDLSFRCLYHDKYTQISKLVATTRAKREEFINGVVLMLQKEIKDAGIKAEVTGRPKHMYSIYKKMERYSGQGRDFDQIFDLFAFRVLVDDIASCYAVLGLVHQLWRPIPGQIDDYIANPRENLYQSLHTSVMGPGAVAMEVQIRTQRMHEIAEYGVAAHFRYKEGGHGDHRFDEKLTWLRQLLDFQKEQPEAEQFLESVKTDIFPDQVFVYTPKGEVRELPVGATPVDFAYRIHTELGHHCVGAKVNGKMTALDTALKNGDTVEIMVSKGDKGPTLDWLNPDLGYVKTANARDRVRAWFRKRARGENIEAGRTLLERELRRLQLGISEDAVAALLGHESTEDLLANLGSGAMTTHQLAPKLLATAEAPLPPVEAPVHPATSDGVMVMGQSNMLIRLAACCHPLAGDQIVGFVTRSRGLTVHRAGCRNVHYQNEPQRMLPVSWGSPKVANYHAKVTIEAWDRVGLLRDITTVVSTDRVNIAGVRSEKHKNGTVSEVLTLETGGADQLSRLLSRLEAVKGVISVSRRG
ncbi:MAG: bifunctional (p)ppGpp synthetase/guanosine-3',5'-bis(diphosphate) 3'-pyrophosphohydrolase [Dehalococcoidia bacterium]|nr:bifunctional (p)ppGpp synthetase/guanosine-3',5'-bis(diphosphate) 3'-pyrophosphohydrolase [Dehalococcoidia bacterium]